MKTKTLENENINFLNNQNYILGNTEKKKLLSKFFVEKIVNDFYKLIGNYHYFFSILGVFLFIYLFSLKIEVLLFTFFLFIGVQFMKFVYTEGEKERGEYIYIKKDKKEIKGFKNIFIDKAGSNQELSNIIIIAFIMFSFYVHLVLLLSAAISFNIYGLSFYYYVLLSIIFLGFYYKSSPLNINLGSIVFVPFLLIGYLFNIIISFFYVLFIKKIEGFKFIKKNVIVSFIKKFDNIEYGIAENKYYKIIEK